MDEPSYDLVSVKKEDGFVATATVALQPTLELGKTQGFEVSCTIPATTDKEVERVIERRRAGFAELVPHKGPAVQGQHRPHGLQPATSTASLFPGRQRHQAGHRAGPAAG